MSSWQPAYIGVGSNMGDPVAEVRTAIQSLGRFDQTLLINVSRLYRTTPFGPVRQDDFINAVAGVLTQLTPQALLAALRGLEAAHGRKRAERWGPRILDVAPDLDVPGAGRVADMLRALPDTGIAGVLGA
jgi:2-amino-4-hydroxy-6-hydroxymethyldihydropteridine diphosphokinase